MKNYSITFLIKSDTVNLDHYTIKDIPGSSGRLDVISRCILSALLNENGFDNNSQIWVYFKNYKNLQFDPHKLNYEGFPKTELLLSDYIVNLLKSRENCENKPYENSIDSIGEGDSSILETLRYINRKKKRNLYVLKETGSPFSKAIEELTSISDLYFIIGNQCEDFINSEAFLNLNIPELSLGTKSYLASQVVRLVKLNIQKIL
ncbi:MAG: putative tRNA (pseudouridine(54)-N(1))-methyltransferase [Promethearchaeota archaeon]|nr:MAG: putative tRNA (pseudouridine(54)-N(1))-methyltransferase [Candidatus Lokiarchaeota archaeon]